MALLKHIGGVAKQGLCFYAVADSEVVYALPIVRPACAKFPMTSVDATTSSDTPAPGLPTKIRIGDTFASVPPSAGAPESATALTAAAGLALLTLSRRRRR